MLSIKGQLRHSRARPKDATKHICPKRLAFYDQPDLFTQLCQIMTKPHNSIYYLQFPYKTDVVYYTWSDDPNTWYEGRLCHP